MNPKEKRAMEFAMRKHGSTLDDEGKLYFSAHIMHVVDIVKKVTTDIDVICAAYLHDTVEDTNTTFEEIEGIFGERVANLVWELTHEGEKDNYGYYFPNLESLDAILIKFADRMSNLSRMSPWPPKRQEAYIRKSRFWKDGSDKQ